MRLARADRRGLSRRVRRLFEQLEDRWLLSLDVPALSSLAGANHTIYLDYDGHITEDTPWNDYFGNPSIHSPAYDTDGDFQNFSTSELANIVESWQRVAEDFAPFHVNVTTVFPGLPALIRSGAGDTQWGIRVVMTDDTEGCGCGGIAYIDSFNWDFDMPTFVYNNGAKAVAEAISHEVGHSLGLAHDGYSGGSYYPGHGSGETGWASLMGVGYYVNVSQWDRGEFFSSNNGGSGANYGKGPDDLAVITSFNGFGYRADDHGNTNATATPLGVSGVNVSGAGIIERTADVDVFRFTTGTGPVSLNVLPFAIGPNLDIKADLYNSAGQLVATSNDSTVLGASINVNLSAGAYFLRIDGTGWGNPGANPPTGYSDYASLGQYTVSGTVTPVPTPTFSISDIVMIEDQFTAQLVVTMIGAPTSPISVNFATANGTATAGSDYVATSGQLTFLQGETSKTISIPIINNSVPEPHETFFVNLSSNSAGTEIADGQALATIQNDDVEFGVSDYADFEGNPNIGPTKDFYFTVTLPYASARNATVHAQTFGITAAANLDFILASEDLVVTAGQTTATLIVKVKTDLIGEPHELFSVDLTGAVGGTIVDNQGIGTIYNDDTIRRIILDNVGGPQGLFSDMEPCNELPFWDSNLEPAGPTNVANSDHDCGCGSDDEPGDHHDPLSNETAAFWAAHNRAIVDVAAGPQSLLLDAPHHELTSVDRVFDLVGAVAETSVRSAPLDGGRATDLTRSLRSAEGRQFEPTGRLPFDLNDDAHAARLSSLLVTDRLS